MEKFGGICGQSYITISKCYNKGTTVKAIGGSSHAGGIVGEAYSSTIKNCYNTGAVTGYIYAGGIVGYGHMSNDANYGGFGIYGCYNTGGVESTATSSTSRAGGICAYGTGTSGSSGYTAYIEYCYNAGVVRSNGTTSAGGIIGYASVVKVSNCRNSWRVYLTNASSSAYPGGIIGYWSGSDTSMSNVTWRSDLVTYSVGAPSTKRSSSGTGVTTTATFAQMLSLINGYGNAYIADTQNINGSYPILAWQVK